jgi:DNA primase
MDPVLELIQSKGLDFKISGQDYLVKCLNPDHEDTNPSLRIDKSSGATHCFSCGFKTNIFKHYGFLSAPSSLKINRIKDKLNMLKQDFNGLDLPEGHTPFRQDYRDISSDTYKHFEAFTTYLDPKLQERIVFPIKDTKGKVLVFIGRSTSQESDRARYLVHPQNSEVPVFPMKFDKPYKSVVLVEGIFDLLNLYDKNIKNVACCFGTNTLHKNTALKLLPFKVQGVRKVYILFDGDAAGRKAAETLKPLIEQEDFEVEILDLPDGEDPGSLDRENIMLLAQYIN